MASVEKFGAGAVRNQLRHNSREIEHSGNPDIDPERLGQDYVLSPDRGMSDYDYFLHRKSELYCYGRDDVKVMAGWIVTAPHCQTVVNVQKGAGVDAAILHFVNREHL